MPRLTARSAAVATAVALGVAGTAVAAAGVDDEPQVAGLPLVARVVQVNVVGDRYDLEAGDRLFADGAVLLGRSGERIGAASFACTVTRGGRRLRGTCAATLHLPLGRITGRWPLERSRSVRTRPVTGGSGFYRGATGRFVLRPTRRNGDTPFTIDLTASGDR